MLLETIVPAEPVCVTRPPPPVPIAVEAFAPKTDAEDGVYLDPTDMSPVAAAGAIIDWERPGCICAPPLETIGFLWTHMHMS